MCGRHRVYRLMRKAGIVTTVAKRQHRSTHARHRDGFQENLLARRFQPNEANQRWVSDITHIPTKSGWLYLAIVMDLYSRAIIGWSMKTTMDTSLISDALMMALWRRAFPTHVLVHSDQGSQYRSKEYQHLLTSYQLTCSMSRKGNCWDNAVAESFFHTLKVELIHGKKYSTFTETKKDIFDYIEIFYNQQRRHSYLGYLSPFQYEGKL